MLGKGSGNGSDGMETGHAILRGRMGSASVEPLASDESFLIRIAHRRGDQVSDIEQGETPNNGAVVLVVEDEVLIRMMAAEILRDEGFTVLEAANAVEALVLFSSELRLDVVLTDVNMPGELDGVKLTHIVKEAKPDLPVALLSGHFDPSGEHAADGFLRKPYSNAELLALVRELIDKRCKNQKISKAS